jgi:hypothetical protein
MSPIGDVCRRKMARASRELVDFATLLPMARTLQGV